MAATMPTPAKSSILSSAWPNVWACQEEAGAASAACSNAGVRRMLKAGSRNKAWVFIGNTLFALLNDGGRPKVAAPTREHTMREQISPHPAECKPQCQAGTPRQGC